MLDIRDAVNDFCLREYGDFGDFDDPHRVPFLYTTVDEEQLEDDTDDPYMEYNLQIYLDLVDLRAVYCFGIDPAFPGIVEQYDSAEQMARDIQDSDFNDWYSSALYAYRYRGHYTRDWEV